MIERQAVSGQLPIEARRLGRCSLGSKNFEPFFVTDPFSERIALRAGRILQDRKNNEVEDVHASNGSEQLGRNCERKSLVDPGRASPGGPHRPH
jgi:hypothetical protein